MKWAQRIRDVLDSTSDGQRLKHEQTDPRGVFSALIAHELQATHSSRTTDYPLRGAHIPGTMRYLAAEEFVFSDRWSDLRGHDFGDEERRGGLERQLVLEVSEGHVLFGKRATAVAACGHCDDAIFQLDDGQFVVVHLVWQGQQRPPWPNTDVLGVWDSCLLYTSPSPRD